MRDMQKGTHTFCSPSSPPPPGPSSPRCTSLKRQTKVRRQGEERITFLARVRNLAMAPLYEFYNRHKDPAWPLALDAMTWGPDYVVILSDVWVCWGDMLRLMAHRADIACGLDLAQSPGVQRGSVVYWGVAHLAACAVQRSALYVLSGVSIYTHCIACMHAPWLAFCQPCPRGLLHLDTCMFETAPLHPPNYPHTAGGGNVMQVPPPPLQPGLSLERNLTNWAWSGMHSNHIFYDIWVARDIGGHRFNGLFPFVTDEESGAAIRACTWEVQDGLVVVLIGALDPMILMGDLALPQPVTGGFLVERGKEPAWTNKQHHRHACRSLVFLPTSRTLKFELLRTAATPNQAFRSGRWPAGTRCLWCARSPSAAACASATSWRASAALRRPR